MAKITQSLSLQHKAQRLIPGKTQLLSKRPEMFAPGIWPGYYSRAKGQEIWDADGNHYFDYSIAGIGANILGYADDDVNNAVIKCIEAGSSSSLNSPEEIELAELFVKKHKWADMVRYSRSGGEAVSIAVRIARAFTKRDKIVFCGYHGWHDWYLSTNLQGEDRLSKHLLSGLTTLGVPKSLAGTTIPFHYNNIEEFRDIMSLENERVAAVIMEPTSSKLPNPGFLEEVKKITKENGSMLIFDEISSGYRVNSGGIHLEFNVTPDIAVFSKAISNGFPMGIVAGRREVMESAQETFISSTSWSERTGPTATLATIQKYEDLDAHKHLIQIGELVRSGWSSAARAANLEILIEGLPSITKFTFVNDKDLVMKTYFTQRMLEEGFLASGRFYAMYAHTHEVTEMYVEATKRIFIEISELLNGNSLESSLKGGIAHSGFQRLN